MRHAVLATLLIGLLVALSAPASLAVQPEEVLDDPALETRARDISKGLRCVVCDNQSIDDSDADVAADMRKLVRDRLLAGDTDEQVVARIESYYGEYVLLQPRVSVKNAAIWLAPIAALALGLAWYLRRTGRTGAPAPASSSPTAAPAPLSEAEQRRLKQLLDD